MKRPRIRNLMLLLLLGAITNVLATWGMLILIAHPRSILSELIDSRGAQSIEGTIPWPTNVPSGWPSHALYRVSRPGLMLREDIWIGVRCISPEDEPGRHIEGFDLRLVRAGFPFKALTAAVYTHGKIRTSSSGGPLSHWESGLSVSSDWMRLTKNIRSYPLGMLRLTLPVQPAWGAFVTNSIFWALVIWGVHRLFPRRPAREENLPTAAAPGQQ